MSFFGRVRDAIEDNVILQMLWVVTALVLAFLAANVGMQLFQRYVWNQSLADPIAVIQAPVPYGQPQRHYRVLLVPSLQYPRTVRPKAAIVVELRVEPEDALLEVYDPSKRW